MASFFKLLVTLLLAWTVTSTGATARTLNPASTLAARLQLDALSNCWDSLFKLQSCTGEVVMFFLNGEAYLGPSCCRAIRIVEHECWPAMIGTLGFTEQEGDILRGYCDAGDEGDQLTLLPPTPTPPSDDGVAETISMKSIP
ncbi:Egg cell-secreted protein 1.1 [Morella rubra]|uniref:Egg cell-secreted protein 1.1 n=1 Tax=Morella rubra TaxID=262757 RepID=A0A6A1W4B3_9ROSI|nr:Egg cell-secreted protein 1.1 [Morella rubra]KAB1220074.1 Egg cell-secreted protein 1.1 [Morella rubra]